MFFDFEITPALMAVIHERQAQDEKWGEQNHSALKWLAILLEECGEVAQDELSGNYDEYRREMVQVAAVALAAVESYDRQKRRERNG